MAIDHLDVSDITPRIAYTVGATSQTVFAVPFVFFSDADLIVAVNGVVKVLGTHYTVTGAEVQGGGSVTFLAGQSNCKVTIVRDVAIALNTHIPSFGPLDVGGINIQFARFIAIQQELNARSIQLPNDEGATGNVLAAVASRKNKMLGFGTNGEIIYTRGPSYISDTSVGTAAVDSLSTAQITNFPSTTNAVYSFGYATEGDLGAALYVRRDSEPTHPGKFQSGDGAWWELSEPAVNVMMFGAKGDGVSFDEDAINNAHAAAIALGVPLDLPGLTFVVRATKTATGLGTGTRKYALDLGSNSFYRGVKGKTVIKMADGQSTDLSPQDVNIFMVTAAVTNIHLHATIFDCNGANNPISPNRGSGDYNRYCSGTLNITGNDAWVDGLYITDCEFINCPGTNQIVTGQSANDVAGPLSQNVHILRNKFRNNGLDTDDHSTVYSWGENCWTLDNIFTQDASLDRTGKNWVSFEIHGANTWFCRNRVENYYRGLWIASNFTNDSIELHIESNNFKVFGNGPSVFRALETLTFVGEVHILNNDIYLMDGVSLSAQRIGVSVGTSFPVGSIFIRGNTVRAAGTGYDSQMVNLSTLVGSTIKQVHISDNYAEGVVTGTYVRTNDGDGLLTDIHETNNTYVNLGSSDTSLASAGSRYQYTGGDGIGTISCINNKYLDRAGLGNFDLGINIIGPIDRATIEGNSFEGMVSFPGGSPYSIDASGAAIIRRVGRQICSGTVAPTSGTWLSGEEFYNIAPTKVWNIDKWKMGEDGAWHAYGAGYGTTAERPTSGLTTADAGYSYYDTSLAKMIMWDGASWNA